MKTYTCFNLINDTLYLETNVGLSLDQIEILRVNALVYYRKKLGEVSIGEDRDKTITIISFLNKNNFLIKHT